MDQEKTVRITGDETITLTSDDTVALAADRTVALTADQTVALTGGDETVAGTGDETVALAAGEPTVRISAQPTIHLAAPTGHPAVPPPVSTPAVPPPLAARPVPAAGTARTTPAAARTTAGTRYVTGRAGNAGAGVPPQAPEVRFGPGVPAPPAPPVAPAWPAPGPARPRRSPWRRISSILSGLLSIVLLAAVGVYLYQRFRPLEVTSVSVAVPQAPGDRCEATVDVVATVRTNGNAGTIRYQWLRSGSGPTALSSERVGRGQRTATLHLKWSFSGVGTTTETATVNITEPSPMQAQTTVTYRCERG